MAKRTKQTGFVTKKQLSRREQEERQKRILFTLLGVAAGAVILVLAFGLYQEYIAKPASPVALVNGKPISTREYQLMVKYRQFELANQTAMLESQLSTLDPTVEGQEFLVQYFQQQLQQLQSQNISLPLDVLDNMVDDELIRQEAARRGFVVTAEEVQEEVEQVFGYERNPPTPTPTPTMTAEGPTPTPEPTVQRMSREDFDKDYSEYTLALRREVGMSEDAFRGLFEGSVYRQKLGEAIGEEVPTSEEQVHARHILVETEDEAKTALDRINAGEDFATLANELSLDTASQDGDLGWFPRGQMVTEFEDAAFSLEPGQISQPISSTYGYHIIEVLERDSNHPLDEYLLEQRKSSALETWLEEQRASDGVKRFWSSDKVPTT
jgi:parvulin-like peptidyl-prolyl isomerase